MPWPSAESARRWTPAKTQSPQWPLRCRTAPAIAAVAPTLSGRHGARRTRILRQQLGSTMTTAEQPSEQRPAVLDCSAHSVASRIVVVGDHGLIALIDIPVNVTLVMIRDQHRPVL